MRKRTLTRIGQVGSASILLTAFFATSASANSPEEFDVLQAIEASAPGITSLAAQTESPRTGEAIREASGQVEVSIPIDPDDSISIATSSGAALSVGLPFADEAANAVSEGSGIVSYDNGNGSRTVPIVIDDGSLAIHTVIDSATAPTRYDYALDVQEGDTASLDASGAIVILGSAGEFRFAIGVPWAKDAAGRDVPTHYEFRNDVLTQIVELTAGLEYPVVADPTIGGAYIDWYSWNAAHDRITIQPTLAGGTFPSGVVAVYGWIELIEATPSVNTTTMNQQFNCHAGFNLPLWIAKQTWDLEGWRVPSGPWGALTSPCNW